MCRSVNLCVVCTYTYLYLSIKVSKEDWEVSSGTPLGQAHASDKPVEVSNIMIDERFHASKVRVIRLRQRKSSTVRVPSFERN